MVLNTFLVSFVVSAIFHFLEFNKDLRKTAQYFFVLFTLMTVTVYIIDFLKGVF